MSPATAIFERLRPPAPHVIIDASPPATRRRRSWWRDSRVIAGVGILVICTVVGGRLLAGSDESVEVWQATRDLAAGSIPSATDLQAVLAPQSVAGAYAAAQGPVTTPLTRPVLAGEFLPLPVEVTAVDARWVTLPIEPLHAPSDLAPGDVIDVWSTSDVDLAAVPRPRLVLDSVLVTDVTVDSLGIGGEYGVTVEVPPSDAETLVTAVRSGVIDLVRAPVITP